MGKQIKDLESWEMGQSYGMIKSIQKFVERNFDLLKAEYIIKLRDIHDYDLVEEINDGIFTTRTNRNDFELMLNTIQYQHREQMMRNSNASQTESENTDN